MLRLPCPERQFTCEMSRKTPERVSFQIMSYQIAPCQRVQCQELSPKGNIDK